MKLTVASFKVRSRRDGLAMLATVVGLVLILSVYTAGVFAYVGTQRRAVANQLDIEQAFTVAEAGVERAAADIQQYMGVRLSPFYVSGNVGSNQYQTVVIPSNYGYEFKIISTGTVSRTTWSGSPMVVRRVVSLSRVWLASWASYSMWTHENGAIYFTSGEVFSGKVHADDAMYFQGNPVFHGAVTSRTNSYVGSTNLVTFDQGFKLNTDAGKMANVSFSNLLLMANTYSNGVVLPADTYLTFNGTNNSFSTNSTYTTNAAKITVTVKRGVTTTTTNWVPVTVTNWDTVSFPATKELIYVQGDVYVAGTLDGRITVVSDGTIHVTNNLLYAVHPTNNSNDALGLIAKNDVWVEASCPTNMSIFAHIMAVGYTNDIPANRGSFGAINYNTRSNGTLTVYGGIVQDLRAAVGLADGSRGYKKKYAFDERFSANPPPFYPPTTESINYTGWEERAP